MSDVTLELATEASDKAVEIARLKAENARLREDLEFERSENGWAREFLNRMGQKCGTKDCPSLVAYVTKLEAENAKLRELCAGLLTGYECGYGELCKGCTWDGLGDSKTFSCLPRVKARELGVEVDG